jgi:hypothetical protein
VISIDVQHTGAGTVTPPAVGLCSAGSVDQVVLMAPYAAPWTGTGLPTGGPAVRLRGLAATARPSVHTTALPEFAVVGVPTERTSSTPGDLPPEDPLS